MFASCPGLSFDERMSRRGTFLARHGWSALLGGAGALLAGRLLFGIQTVALLWLLNSTASAGVVAGFLTALTLGGLLLIAVRGGIDRSAVIAVGGWEDSYVAWAGLARTTLKRLLRLSVAGLLGVGAASALHGWSSWLGVVALLLVSLAPWSLAYSLFSLLQAERRIGAVVIIRDALQPAVLLGLVAALGAGSVIRLVLLLLVSWIVALIFGALVAFRGLAGNRAVTFAIRFPSNASSDASKSRPILWAIQCLDFARNAADGFIVALMLSEAASSQYWTLWRLAVIASLPFAAIVILGSPRLVSAEGHDERRSILQESHLLGTVGGFLPLLAVAALGPVALDIVGVVPSRSTELVLLSLVAGRALDSSMGMTAEGLIYSGCEKVELVVQSVGLLATAVVVFALSWAGATLPAVAIAAASFLTAVNVARYRVYARIHGHFLDSRDARFLLLAGGGAVSAVLTSVWSWPASVGIVATLTALALWRAVRRIGARSSAWGAH